MAHIATKDSDLFKKTADATARAYMRNQYGKGSKPRTSVNSKAWRDNYDSIFRKDK